MYSDLSQTFAMDLFTKAGNDFQPLTIFAKHYILDVRILNTHLKLVRKTFTKGKRHDFSIARRVDTSFLISKTMYLLACVEKLLE